MAKAAGFRYPSISCSEGSGHLHRLKELRRKKQIGGCSRVVPFRPMFDSPDSRKETPGSIIRRYSFF
jgi:hypothetical protein